MRSSPLFVAMLLGVIVLSLLQPGAVLVRAQRCSSTLATKDLITVELQCLEGQIMVSTDATSSSIPSGYSLEYVEFDVYCNSSQGVLLPVASETFDAIDDIGDKTVDLPADATVCRTVLCYRIEEDDGFEKETYFLSQKPVCNYTENIPLEVMLTADALFPIVGSVVNLTCSGNGTPPLTIEFRDSLSETINQDLVSTQEEGSSAVIQRVLQWEVTEMGPLNFTCAVVHNSTSELESSIVEVTGVVRRYVQICFELPQDILCDHFSNFSEILPGFASELQDNCSCIAPGSAELQTLPSTCNDSCPQQLFYSMSVLTESETELNATLREWLSLHDYVMAAGIELGLNLGCAPLIAATVPSPVCSAPVPTSTQIITSTVPSEEPPTDRPPSETPASSATESPETEASSDPVIVFVAVFVLVATFVLLAMTLIIMLFFFHRRRKHVSDFAVEGGDIPMYDPMQPLDQQGFEQQKQEPPSVNNKPSEKSIEVTQTADISTSNGRVL